MILTMQSSAFVMSWAFFGHHWEGIQDHKGQVDPRQQCERKGIPKAKDITTWQSQQLTWYNLNGCIHPFRVFVVDGIGLQLRKGAGLLAKAKAKAKAKAEEKAKAKSEKAKAKAKEAKATAKAKSEEKDKNTKPKAKAKAAQARLQISSSGPLTDIG